ncbi:MAG: hypothetical protein Q9M40_09480 [Sulfurimonas sp.]|nr:hypothetical protein [Sulfurimonas sp.]
MKKNILTLSILISTILLSNELDWVDQQVNAIKPSRVGMKSTDIYRLKNPFVFLEKNRTTPLKTSKQNQPKKDISPKVVKAQKVKTVNKILSLGAILNNSVMISGEWYKIGDMVNGYKIIEISPKSVLLSKHKKQLLLSTKSNSNKLKFLNK